MASTYEPIATTTLANNTTYEIDFQSISGSYTDIVIISNLSLYSGASDLRINFNADTGTNMSGTILYGNGSSAASTRRSGLVQMELDWTGIGSGWVTYVTHVMNYSNSTTYKTFVSRFANANAGTDAVVGLWRSTSAINRIKLNTTGSGSPFASGSTFTLYGILAA